MIPTLHPSSMDTYFAGSHLMSLGRNCLGRERKRLETTHLFIYLFFFWQNKGEESFSTITLYYVNVLNGEYLSWFRVEGNKSGNDIPKVLRQEVFLSR